MLRCHVGRGACFISRQIDAVSAVEVDPPQFVVGALEVDVAFGYKGCGIALVKAKINSAGAVTQNAPEFIVGALKVNILAVGEGR